MKIPARGELDSKVTIKTVPHGADVTIKMRSLKFGSDIVDVEVDSYILFVAYLSIISSMHSEGIDVVNLANRITELVVEEDADWFLGDTDKDFLQDEDPGDAWDQDWKKDK